MWRGFLGAQVDAEGAIIPAVVGRYALRSVGMMMGSVCGDLLRFVAYCV